MGRFNKLSPRKEEIITAYLNGTSLQDIGVVYSSSANTVRNLLLDNNIPLRPKGKTSLTNKKVRLSFKRISTLQREEWQDKIRELGDQAKCSICTVSTSDLQIDHCHITGNVRGILCRKCNSGLGFFQESPELLGQAVLYLTQRSMS